VAIIVQAGWACGIFRLEFFFCFPAGGAGISLTKEPILSKLPRLKDPFGPSAGELHEL
jgi:hypothetical protein